MAAGTGAHLHVAGDSALHRLPTHLKIMGLVALVLAAVSIRPGAWAALGTVTALAGCVLMATRVSWRHTLPRLAVDLPFVVFALLMPFVAVGPTLPWGPFTLSEAGVIGGITLLAKSTTGVLAGVAFAVTTEPRDLIIGLQRLRLPDPLVTIVGFMVRYGSVVASELSRMRIAMTSRGFNARSIRSWGVIATSAGALFVRSFERGERVHLAMISRGYQGRLPEFEHPPVRGADLMLALAPAAIAGLLAVGSRL